MEIFTSLVPIDIRQHVERSHFQAVTTSTGHTFSGVNLWRQAVTFATGHTYKRSQLLPVTHFQPVTHSQPVTLFQQPILSSNNINFLPILKHSTPCAGPTKHPGHMRSYGGTGSHMMVPPAGMCIQLVY